MATKFSLKDPNPGIWFKFDDDDPESGEIRIRPVNQDKRNEIQKKTVKNKVEYKHGQRFQFEEINDDLYSEMLWDYVIAEWNKLEDDDGKPIEDNTENKLFLMKHNVGFAQFVGACLIKANEIMEDRITVVEKNSSSGLSGSKKNRTAKPASD